MTEIRKVFDGNEIRYEDGDDNLIPVESVDEVPPFGSDEECVAFWETHAPTESYLRTAQPSEAARDALARITTRGEPPRIYPPDDEGKRVVEPDEVPDFTSEAERNAYWQSHTLSRTAPAGGGPRPRT